MHNRAEFKIALKINNSKTLYSLGSLCLKYTIHFYKNKFYKNIFCYKYCKRTFSASDAANEINNTVLQTIASATGFSLYLKRIL